MIEVKLQLSSQHEVAILGGAMMQIAALRSGQPMIGTPAPAAEKKPCGCKDKAITASDVPTPEIAMNVAVEVPADPTPAAPKAEPVDGQKLVEAYLLKHGLPATKALLEKFGGRRFGEIPPENLAGLIAALQAGVA